MTGRKLEVRSQWISYRTADVFNALHDVASKLHLDPFAALCTHRLPLTRQHHRLFKCGILAA